jgi:hypothetical protein
MPTEPPPPPPPPPPRTSPRLAAAEAARRALAFETASKERRRRLTHRFIPALLALAITALVLGIVVAATSQSEAERVARNFSAAWERGNYEAMHRMLTPDVRDRLSAEQLAAAYEDAAATATATRIQPGKAEGDDETARVPVTVQTRVFGSVRGIVELRVVQGRVAWRPELVFPGLRSGEALTRKTVAPRRARILDRRGRRIASGSVDSRAAVPGAASSIAGALGPAETEAERQAVEARGFAADTPVGTSGLERALQLEVEGKPGGELLAGSRRLASSEAEPAPDVRSTIDLNIQEAAVTALAGRFGGIAALDPHNGKIRALAGVAFSAPQPPGSVFKIITATAALEQKLVKPTTDFPVETHAIIDGVRLENANGESCGGTFVQTFAHSCNSVFAPLGVKLGAARLVAAAERFGFNQQPQIPGAAMSTIPPATEIDSPLAVGSTAIGQGQVLATPLEMALAASTIAGGGLRPEATLIETDEPKELRRVTSEAVAREVEKMMVEVVRSGTGTAASLAPVAVAGKTGTAELRSTAGPTAATDPEAAGSDTDAWFAAYAPTKRPKLAVGVLFVKNGAGGTTAAPAAKIVLDAAIR